MPSRHQKPPPGFIFIEDVTSEDGTVIRGIATRLGITPSTYRKWRMAGKGPLTTLHGKRVIAREDAVDAYFRDLEQTGAGPTSDSRPPEPRKPKSRATRQPATATA